MSIHSSALMYDWTFPSNNFVYIHFRNGKIFQHSSIFEQFGFVFVFIKLNRVYSFSFCEYHFICDDSSPSAILFLFIWIFSNNAILFEHSCFYHWKKKKNRWEWNIWWNSIWAAELWAANENYFEPLRLSRQQLKGILRWRLRYRVIQSWFEPG